MAAPHAIHEEFPNDAERIHALKISDAHFARLLQEYDQVNDQVFGAESRHTPMSDEAEAALDLDESQPIESLVELIRFVLGYYRAHPEFVTLLNSETCIAASTSPSRARRAGIFLLRSDGNGHR